VNNVREEDIQGGKLVKRFLALVERIRLVAESEKGDPRQQLNIQQLAGHLLFYFFTPILTSLRSIQRASELKKVQKILGCSRAALGSLSEANAVFDPEILRAAIHELVGELRGKQKLPAELKGLTAVDATFLRAVPRMAWALFRSNEKYRGVKAHVIYDVELCSPVDASLTAANSSEKTELRKKLEPDRFYVLDAGYAQYKLFSDIIDVGSSFVCRIREDAVREVLEERSVSTDALEAGIKRDQTVRLGDWKPRKDLEQAVRVIEFQRPRTRPDEEPELMVLATDRLDMDAELIALAYRYRWSVELFFRWFKCVLGCRNLISHSENGVTIQVYMGIIASLLISIWTGRKPNKALLERICFYLLGMADEEELEAAIRGQQRHPAATQ
jgi:hypothetical protein